MKIKKIEYFRLDMPLAVPYTIAYETVSKTTNIILKLVTDSGITGWGCAAPDTEVTGETPEDVINNIESEIHAMLQDKSPFQIAKVNHIFKQQLKGASSTLAMVDMALHDLMARKAKLPLYQLLGGYRNSIPTSITIGILPVEETLIQASDYLKKGFTILKLKGGANLAEDIEKIHKLREKFGREFLLRFDANQGYSLEESVDFITKTKKANIEIFEQPTNQKKDEKLGQVTQSVAVPVMADESIKSLNDTFRLASNNLIDMVNIKLMKMGGILESQHINSVAKAAGMEVMVGCIDECALGISAGLHFALSRPNIEYADLDGHLDLLQDPFTDLFALKNGVLYPSASHGLGNINL
ncbi:MAG: dipeptide epimerase [Calditrichaeota bacterium]|nr:MAG: dipeptide epimerase [Calditrichota bacterium]